jgi:hypothetical protein
MWLANRWKEGLFGEMMYSEYEYVHEIRSLAYTYIDGIPVKPGHTLHNWRSWFNFHYYCTHSLGPVMVITGTRPTMVEAFPCKQHIAGYLRVGRDEGNGTMTPSLIQMDNGGVVRNLMGAATHDGHHQRIWGTRGTFEIGGDGLRLRLGGTGGSPMMKVIPKWEGLGELAANTGHGGGDFWTLYYFAREILTGKKGPFDIYGGCDVTIPGIQALRSSLEGGRPMEVPDFRKKSDRDRYRSDDWHQARYNVKRGVFGGRPVKGKAAEFTTVMKDVIACAPLVRAYLDWKKVAPSLAEPEAFLPIVEKLVFHYDNIKKAYRDARSIMKAYPGTDGARVLSEMLDIGEAGKIFSSGFLPSLKRELAALRRKHGAGGLLSKTSASALIPIKTRVQDVPYPRRAVSFKSISCNNEHGFANRFYDIRPRYDGKARDGLLYARGFFSAKRAGEGKLTVAADGPFKVFVNAKEVFCNPSATNPISANSRAIPVTWKKGRNEVVIAMRTNTGRAWGFMAVVQC